MTKIPFFLVILFSVLLIAGCGGNGDPDSHSDPSSTIRVKNGDEFVISLESNPTTGYSWEESSDSSMVSLVNVDYQQDEAEEGMVGVGGKEFFTYRALQSGETKIEMVYGQHWDGGEVDAPQVFTVIIE
jgi:predicted secreted protein